jgi:hypothetical protein
MTTQHHDPHEAPREHGRPPAMPGLDLCARFAGVRRPPQGGLHERLGRANQGAFCAWGTATRRGWWWRQVVELAPDGEAPHDLGRLGQRTDIILGGLATVRQTPDGPPGHLLRHEVEESAGQLTAGRIRHVECLGLRCLEREFAAYGDAEGVARPTCERNVHDAQHEGQASQRPGFLSCGAGAMAVAVESFNMATSFFLGRIVKAHPHDLARRDTRDCEADNGAPEVPSLVRERAPEEDRAPCKVLDRGGPGEPHIGRNGVTVSGQGPPTGQQREGAPRGRGNGTMMPTAIASLRVGARLSTPSCL